MNTSIQTIQFLKDNSIYFEENVDLKKKTWIHRGGKARFFIQPDNVTELQKCLSYLYKNQYPFLLVGHTSNLYIHNDCDVDIVVSTFRCKAFAVNEGIVECECGASVSKVAQACIDNGYCGMEYLTDLPGTIGAAIYNNSSCKKSSVSALLFDLDFMDTEGNVKVLTPDDLAFSLRSSSLKAHALRGVILKVRLHVEKGEALSLAQVAKENKERRKQILDSPSQNLGCTVNRIFSLGKMPLKYALPLSVYNKILSLSGTSSTKRNSKIKKFILTISGYKDLEPYISDKQMIIFIWRDEKADGLFPRYLEFMRKVYKTDKVEIEEIKRNQFNG